MTGLILFDTWHVYLWLDETHKMAQPVLLTATAEEANTCSGITLGGKLASNAAMNLNRSPSRFFLARIATPNGRLGSPFRWYLPRGTVAIG